MCADKNSPSNRVADCLSGASRGLTPPQILSVQFGEDSAMTPDSHRFAERPDFKETAKAIVHTVFRESRHNAERRVEAEIERIYAAGIWAATGAIDKARQVELTE